MHPKSTLSVHGLGRFCLSEPLTLTLTPAWLAELLSRAGKILCDLSTQAYAHWQDEAARPPALIDAVRSAAIAGNRLADTVLAAHSFAANLKAGGPSLGQVDVILAVKALELLRTRLAGIIELGGPMLNKGQDTLGTAEEVARTQAVACLRDLEWFQSPANEADLLEAHRTLLQASSVLVMLLERQWRPASAVACFRHDTAGSMHTLYRC